LNQKRNFIHGRSPLTTKTEPTQALGEDPVATFHRYVYLMVMNLLIILLVLLVVFGGGGFYFGGPVVGGGGIGLILLICLVVYFMGGFRTKRNEISRYHSQKRTARPSFQYPL
jgi:hypothetical protein